MDSIWFGEKNSWDDFGLFPSPRLVVAPPKPKTSYVDVGGVDGPLDISDALIGRIRYDSRSGSWDFGVKNEHWENAYFALANYLHGQKMKIILSDDPGYYYVGRLSLDSWKSNKYFSQLSISYVLEPYKYEMTPSDEDWLWDPFSFENGIIREYGEINVNGSATVIIPGSTRPCIPSFTVASDGEGMTLSYNNQSYALSDGVNTVTTLLITDAAAILTFTGNGTVSIHYQGGWL